MTEKTKRSIKKIILWCAGILVLAVVLTLLFFGTRSSQDDLESERPIGMLGELALLSDKPQFVQIRPELTFKIDTGADISTITEDDLNILDSLGFDIKRSFYPVAGRDGVGNMNFHTHRVTVDLPLYNWHTKRDSLGNTTNQCEFASENILHNVDFAISHTGFSVLGIDFLEKFAIEARNSDSVIAIYWGAPDSYEIVAPLHTSITPGAILTPGHRYYMSVDVDGIKDDYFLDTGVMRAFVKRPTAELNNPDAPQLYSDTVHALRHSTAAVADPKSWVVIGNREGRTTTYYFDDDEESHMINPLNLFDNINMLFDFPNHRFMMQK